MTDLAEAVLRGERLALARLLTQVENDTRTGQAALDRLFAYTGRAHLVGVTGSPGTGKSSLVNQLARVFRTPLDGQSQQRVAVVAVDPSSPFSGGAVLGDRVRMRDLAGDPGVFVRSMASRGALGGLAGTTAAMVQVLDAAGYDIIFIETVGAGQAEVDVAQLAHTTLVIEAPGLGDDIQAIKAGILEIADILVINKADRPGVENTERALRTMLELSHTVMPCDGEARWTVPVYLTIAPQASGVRELAAAILEHGAFLRRGGGWQCRERNRLQTELNAMLQAALVARWRDGVPEEMYQNVLHALLARSLSPFQAVEQLIR